MKSSPQLKKYLTYIGYLLVLLSIYYLVELFIANFDALTGFPFTPRNNLILLLLLSFHFISYGLASYAWLLQLRPRYKTFTIKQAYSIIGRSQIGKYLPGNIGHFVARLVLLPAEIKKSDASYTLFVESILLMIVSAGIGAFYIFYFDLRNVVDNARVIQLSVIAIIFFIATYFGLKILRRRYDILSLSVPTVIKVTSLLVLNLLMGGLTIYLLFAIYGVADSITYIQCLSGYALSFVIGFVVPGAPGGIGIREFIFVLLFGRFIGDTTALEVILIFRVLNITGDFLLYGVSHNMRDKNIETVNG